MTATAAIPSYGSTFKWNGVALAELNSIGWNGISWDTIPATHYTSPSRIKEFLQGFGDGGEITVKGNFIPGDTTGQIAFIADAQAGTPRTAIITLSPDETDVTWTFSNALVTNFAPDLDMEGKLGFTATIKVSGAPVLGVTQADQLSALTVTTATLVPAFAAAKYSYTANTTGTSVTVTPTCAGADSIDVYADEVLVSSLASGGTSSAIAITTAANVEIKICVKIAGKVDRTYTATLFKSA